MKRENDLLQLFGVVRDHLNNLNSSVSLFKEQATNYPVFEVSHNKRTKEVFVVLALAGYKKEDISIEEKKGTLSISSRKSEEKTEIHPQSELEGLGLNKPELNLDGVREDEIEYWSAKRIAKRAFKLVLNTSNLKVSKAAKFEDGLLTITLVPNEEDGKTVEIS